MSQVNKRFSKITLVEFWGKYAHYHELRFQGKLISDYDEFKQLVNSNRETTLKKNFTDAQKEVKDHLKKRFIGSLIACIFSLQIFLATMKVDGYISSNWASVFTPIWIIDTFGIILIIMMVSSSISEPTFQNFTQKKLKFYLNTTFYIFNNARNKILTSLMILLFIVFTILMQVKLECNLYENQLPWSAVVLPWYFIFTMPCFMIEKTPNNVITFAYFAIFSGFTLFILMLFFDNAYADIQVVLPFIQFWICLFYFSPAFDFDVFQLIAWLVFYAGLITWSVMISISGNNSFTSWEGTSVPLHYPWTWCFLPAQLSIMISPFLKMKTFLILYIFGVR